MFVKAKIQDKGAHLKQCQGQNPGQGSTFEKMLRQRSKTRKQTWDNVKAKVQDKEAHLKQCQGKDSGQGSKTQNNVQAKIQDKEVHLRQCQG